MGKISFTTDMWSSDSLDSYLTMTVHWIAQDEKTGSLFMKIVLVAFCHVLGEHSGEELGNIIFEILGDVEIPVEKVGPS